MNPSYRTFALAAAISLTGCQTAPPMSKATFMAAAGKCDLRATTYLHRDGVLIDEPLIDFTKEVDPAKAHQCFNSALDEVDRETTERGETHFSYIWEWRA